MSQDFTNYFLHSPTFKNESQDFFKDDQVNINNNGTNKHHNHKTNYQENDAQGNKNNEVAYHTNLSNDQILSAKNQFYRLVDQKFQNEAVKEEEKENQKAQNKEQNDIVNCQKRKADKITGKYPLPYNQQIQIKEINLSSHSTKMSQEKQNDSILSSKKIEDRLYSLQFQQLKKLEQIRQYKFKKEMSELRDPEIDFHSQEIISNRPKQKIEERLLLEGKKILEKQEQKKQDYENYFKKNSTPKINSSNTPQIQYQLLNKHQKRTQDNELCESYEQLETDVVDRLFAFQNHYQYKKSQLEQQSQQNILQECTFKPEITSMAKNMVRKIDQFQVSPIKKALKEQQLRNQHDQQHCFKPQIDKQSIILAQKRGTSFERLIKPKIQKEHTPETFKPTINQQSSMLVQRQKNVFDQLYKKNQQYKNKIEKKKEQLQTENKEKEQLQYTFKPQINNYLSKSFINSKSGSKDFLNSLENSFQRKKNTLQRLFD